MFNLPRGKNHLRYWINTWAQDRHAIRTDSASFSVKRRKAENGTRKE